MRSQRSERPDRKVDGVRGTQKYYVREFENTRITIGISALYTGEHKLLKRAYFIGRLSLRLPLVRHTSSELRENEG